MFGEKSHVMIPTKAVVEQFFLRPFLLLYNHDEKERDMFFPYDLGEIHFIPVFVYIIVNFVNIFIIINKEK